MKDRWRKDEGEMKEGRRKDEGRMRERWSSNPGEITERWWRDEGLSHSSSLFIIQLNYTNLHLNNVRPHTHTHTRDVQHIETACPCLWAHMWACPCWPWSHAPPAGSPVSSGRLGPRGRRSRSGWCDSTWTPSSGRTTPVPGGSMEAPSSGTTGGCSAREEVEEVNPTGSYSTLILSRNIHPSHVWWVDIITNQRSGRSSTEPKARKAIIWSSAET